MREIVLDTETTGLLPEQGHRIIEIGAVELIGGHPTGRALQQYLDPERDIDPGAQAVHGISREMLTGQPRFRDIADELIDWLRSSRLVIHNAPFDVGFIDAELARLGPTWGHIAEFCAICCTRAMANQRWPGHRNSLDNLCDHYGIDRSARTQHGALLDAELLTRVYLAMLRDKS
jgi:DNA polymerase III subunit epsilon